MSAFEPKTFDEQLMFLTVRLEGMKADGSPSTGTGFIYRHPLSGERTLPMLFTNKHVVKGVVRLNVRVHLATDDTRAMPSGILDTVTLDARSGMNWINHPDDAVDICGMPFLFLEKGLSGSNAFIYFKGVGVDMIPSQAQLDALGAVNQVLMVGYPNGLWDVNNNLPLIRAGITANHPAISMSINVEAESGQLLKYQNQQVVDMTCVPGSSGSPIFIYDQGTHYDKATKSNVMGGARVYFLGMLWGGPQQTVEGPIVVKPIPTNSAPVANVRIPIGLGYAFKAAVIKDFAKLIAARTVKPEPKVSVTFGDVK